ncbi:hypothetical protein IFR05_006501 [Cadophora sp. M221]|nr:hypothetical protein IFR05_006501 [Cadophora sp. M221]
MSTASTTNGSPSTSSDLVHVLADLFNKLLSLVENLRNYVSVLRTDISDLRGKNSTLADEVQFLKRTSGAGFRYFQKLPIEIRLAIWRFALTAPQIHVFGEKKASVSTVNMVMQACKEARDEGLALGLDYYEHCSIYPQHSHLMGPRQYMNMEVDTFWLVGNFGNRLRLAETISVFCGRCNIERFPRRSQCRHKSRIGRVAVSGQYWEIPDLTQDIGNGNYGQIPTVRCIDPREVLIIVSEAPETYEHVFEFADANGKPHDGDGLEEVAAVMWERNAREQESRLAAFKACRINRIIEHGIARGMTMEEITAPDVDSTIPEPNWTCHLYKMYSSWELPKVRFVEMNKASWCNLY